MKNILSFQKHLSKEKLEEIFNLRVEIKDYEFLEKYFQDEKYKIVLKEFELKAKDEWPCDLTKYFQWSIYPDMREYFTKWLRRIAEDGGIDEKEMVLNFLEEKGYPEDLVEIIKEIGEYIEERDQKMRLENILKEKAFKPEGKENLKEKIEKKLLKKENINKENFEKAKELYNEFLHIKECKRCFNEFYKISEEEFQIAKGEIDVTTASGKDIAAKKGMQKKEIRIAAAQGSVFKDVIEYKDIYWDIKEIPETKQNFLLVKFKRIAKDAETKELKEEKNYLATICYEEDGTCKDFEEIEIIYEDEKIANCKENLIEIGVGTPIKFKIGGKEYKIDWKKDNFLLNPIFYTINKEKIEEKDILENFLKNKKFYKNFFKGIKDNKLKDILESLFIEFKEKVEDIEKLKEINEIIDFLWQK